MLYDYKAPLAGSLLQFLLSLHLGSYLAFDVRLAGVHLLKKGLSDVAMLNGRCTYIEFVFEFDGSLFYACKRRVIHLNVAIASQRY